MTPFSLFLSGLAQAVIVVAGWYVVHILSVNRDRDKARRETIVAASDALSTLVNTLLADARAYHSAERDISDELLIKMAIQDISLQLTSLSDIFSNTSTLAHCRTRVLRLRRAITGAHFEDEHLSPLADNDRQYQVMAEAALELKRVLIQIKHQQLL